MTLVHFVANSLVSPLPCNRFSRGATLSRLDDLPDRFLQALGDFPSGVVGLHLAKVAVVTNMVADTILIDIVILLSLARESLGNLEGLQN